jgi:DNA polymerase-1
VPSSRLLLIDGHSVAYRAFYALPVENFSTTTGQPTNAVYGFTSMLINVLRDERPTHVAVAFDVSRHTFRTDTFPEYKANRAASPPEFAGQVDLIKEVVAALRIPVLSVEGFEADDIIATMARQSGERGWTVDIVTGDRDAFQLVSDRVTVLYPKKGVSDLARMTPAAVEEKYGLTPEQYPDYAALRGDPSDNLPGIPGVGEKTAAKWIREYGSLAALIDRADEVSGKVGDAFRAALPQVLTNRHLTSLVTDVALDLNLDDTVLEGWDRAEVDRLFDTLQFRALRDRLDKVRPTAEGDVVPSAVVPVPSKPVVTLTGAAAATWLSEASGVPAVAVAGEWMRGRGSIEAVVVVDDRGTAAFLDCSDSATSTSR